MCNGRWRWCFNFASVIKMDYKMFLNNSSSNQTYSTYNMYPYCNSSSSSGPVLYPNRFVYVNQNFVHPKAPTSILINPNFKKTVHINPNFNKVNAPPPTKSVIHVNPEVLKLKKPPDEPARKLGAALVSTRTKLIRVCDGASAKRKRRKSLHTTYKIVRSGTPKAESVKSSYTKTKFKIDKVGGGGPARSLVIKQANKSKFLSINGVLYKKTPNVLKKATVQSGSPLRKNKVLRIGGHVYKVDSNRRTLKRVDLNESGKVYAKSIINKKLLLLSQMKRGGKRILPSKLRKSNVPCPIYRKFGKCRGKENGSCIRIHDPNQIALCTRFLQGACLDGNCPLSHKVSPEKMPTCKYFLEGLCSKEDCPYLHVKINPRAPICKDFLEGFCKSAQECDKRHQFLCPEFEKSGTCIRRRCPYPHGKVVRELANKVRSKVVKRVVKNRSAKSPPAEENESNHRYYEESKKESSDGNISDKPSISIGRPKLGRLPSFIPLGQARG